VTVTRRSRTAAWSTLLATLLAVGLFFYAWLTGLVLQDHPFHRFTGITGKKVILTIDDGPDPRFTPDVLDILKKHEAKATFFIVGNAARRHPALIRRIIAEGHEIANHTMTHSHLERIPHDDVVREITGAQSLLHAMTGSEPRYFRPPRGRTSKTVDEVLSDTGLTTVYWTFAMESKDAPTPEKMALRAMLRLRPGSILLMHDGLLDRTKSVKALKILLDHIDAANYKAISLKQASALPGAKLEEG